MSAEISSKAPDASIAPDASWLRRRAVRGGAVLMGSRLVVQGFTWVVTLLVARYLRPYDYGVLAAGGIFIALGDLLAEAGVGRALVQKREVTARDAAAAFTLSLTLALLVYGLLFLIAAPAASYFSNPDVTSYIRVAGLVVLISPFRAVPAALLDRQLKLEHLSALQLVMALFQSTTVLALAASGFGYWALALGTLLARVSEAGGLAALARWTPRLSRPGPADRELFRFGMHLSGASILWVFYSNADYAVVGRVAGPVALGYYSLAFMLISLPAQKITAIVNQVAYPVYCRLQHDPGRMRDWYLRSTVLLGFLGLPVMVGMALVAPEAVGVVLGLKWTPAVVPLQFLSIVGALKIFSASLMPFCNAMGRPDINLRYNLACAVLFPPSFYLGGIWGGLFGICMVWVVLYPLVVAGLVVATRRSTGIGVLALIRAQRPVLLAVLTMATSVVAVRQSLPASVEAPTRLFLLVGVGVLAYSAVVSVMIRHGLLSDIGKIWAELRGRPPGGRAAQGC